MPVPRRMRAMVFEGPGEPLVARDIATPEPGDHDVLIAVEACGVCRTDLHVVDGELEHPKPHLVPGHEIVGTVVASGKAGRARPGNRVGVPWLAHTCGACRFCLQGSENLCDAPQFTGYTVDGGYAEFALARDQFCFPIPSSYMPIHAAPLLCAGLIGYRSYRMAGAGAKRLGIYGFGAAAHIIAQVAVHQGREVFAFTKAGDCEGQRFAMALGAVWAGDSDRRPPVELDAAIIFAPVGSLVPAALQAVRKGGVVVCGGIHMSDIPSFRYSLLWGERTVRSVANLTRQDGEELLALAPAVPVRTEVQAFPLESANEALRALREGRVHGAAVLVP